MQKAKKLLRKAVPKSLLDNLHYPEAIHFARKYGRPADSMVIIGIVGSKGKTTTANMVWSVLSSTGLTVGQIGTANIRIGGKEELNKYHMTMPGASSMQKILWQMKKAGCSYVVMEVPSEAQTQWRHIGINFDILVFTNVEREIVASHRGSMEILHQHNKRVFAALEKSDKKIIKGKIIPKIIVANADSKDAASYSSFKTDRTVTYSVHKKSTYQATDIAANTHGVDFTLNNQPYHINILGSINASNAAAAIAVGVELEFQPADIATGLNNLASIPGRMEVIAEGQDYSVVVDYAHSPASMESLMQGAIAMQSKNSKIITLLGAEGGGRDIEKRPILGELAAKSSDYVVITNVDPYEDDPTKIIEDVALGARKTKKRDEKDLFCIEDRREAIAKSLSLANKGDLVLITGKGSEQSIVISGKSTPWDDRTIVREELKNLLKK